MMILSRLCNSGGRRVASTSTSVSARGGLARCASSSVSGGSALSGRNRKSENSAGNNLRRFSAAATPEAVETATVETSTLRDRGILDSDNLLNFTTLHDMQRNACEAFSQKELFGTYNPTSEKFDWMTFEEFDSKVRLARSVLKEDLGIVEGSKIGIISNNRWEWAALACASYGLNATFVPMYEAQLPSDWLYILNDAGCNALFCATEEIYHQSMLEVVPHVPTLNGTLCLDSVPGNEDHTFESAMDRASKRDEATGIIEPTPDDLAGLVYTSGTTGKPKGVELLHSNFTTNVKAVRTMVDDPHEFIRPDQRSLAFLPWAHSYGQTCELWMGMAHGGSMGVCRGVPSILEDLQLVKPTVLFSVPTLYKRVYDGVHNLIETSSPMKQRLMRKALELARKNTTHVRDGEGPSLGFIEKIQYDALNKIVLSKIRDRFGGNLRHGFVAGAACPREIIDFMDDIGIPIYEGYGLTETSPIIAINAPGHRRVGCVGKAVTGVTAVILGDDGEVLPPGEEGEICCYGPNVMRGYHNKPKETEEVISVAPDGKSRLFHTGDMGKMLEDGFIKITGRIKEQYKLENGKYVVPTPIEEAIGMSRFIRQVVLCGANRPHNVALLVPEWDAIRAELDIDEKDIDDSIVEEELVNDKRVKRLIDAEIEANCVKLKKFEVPTEWAFVAPFTAANNMLTPKMSIRRHMVVRAYQDVIAGLYEKEAEEEAEDAARQLEGDK